MQSLPHGRSHAPGLPAPLKQPYRDDPLSSRTPLEAEASFETDGVTASVQASLMRSVATAMGINIADARLHATAMFDARGTLGIARDVPTGVQEINIVAELETDANDASLAKLGELMERYCVVGQSLAHIPAIAIRRSSE